MMDTMRTLVALLLAAALTGAGAAAPPTVESVAPGVGQRGTEFTLVLSGARLSDPKELIFYSPGVTCTKLTATSESQVTVTLKAAADSARRSSVSAPHVGRGVGGPHRPGDAVPGRRGTGAE
jgi:hypothetical protein